MPELAVKIKTAPNKRSTAINGTSHHFFSCFEKRQNSFRSDHMIDLECKIYIRACKENLTCRVRSAGVTIRGFGRNLRLNVRPPWLRRYPRRGRRWQRHLSWAPSLPSHQHHYGPRRIRKNCRDALGLIKSLQTKGSEAAVFVNNGIHTAVGPGLVVESI
jgi:hypothetical protein